MDISALQDEQTKLRNEIENVKLKYAQVGTQYQNIKVSINNLKRQQEYYQA